MQTSRWRMIGSNVILSPFIGNWNLVRAPRELGPTSMPYFHRRIRCHLITTSMRRRADTVYIYDASSRSKFKTLRKLREKVVEFLEKSEYGHSCDISIVESRIDVSRWTSCVQLPTGPGRWHHRIVKSAIRLGAGKFDINFVLYLNQI